MKESLSWRLDESYEFFKNCELYDTFGSNFFYCEWPVAKILLGANDKREIGSFLESIKN